MLAKLLSVKRQRERDAIARLGESKLEYNRLQVACRAKEQELLNYGNWRKQETTRLYESVHRQQLSPSKLEGYRQQISLLRSRELKLEDELADARHSLEGAGLELKASRRRGLEARREVVRFEEYVSRLTNMENLRAERREETETEETVTTRFAVERAEHHGPNQ